MYILYDSSLVVCFSNIIYVFCAKRSNETLITQTSSRENLRRFSLQPVPIVWRVAGQSRLVLSFQMSFRRTYCARQKQRSNHEINRYVYPP